MYTLWMADVSSFHRNRTPGPTLQTHASRSCIISTYQSGMGTVLKTRTESVRGAKMLGESDVSPTYFSFSYFCSNCFRKLGVVSTLETFQVLKVRKCLEILACAFWRNKEMPGRVQIPMNCHKKVPEVGNTKSGWWMEWRANSSPWLLNKDFTSIQLQL